MRRELAWFTVILVVVAAGAWWNSRSQVTPQPVTSPTETASPSAEPARLPPGQTPVDAASRASSPGQARPSPSATPVAHVRPAPRSQADADDVREFVVRAVASEMARFHLKRIYLHVDKADPSDAFLARFETHRPPIVKGTLFTEWEKEGGCGYIALDRLSWGSDHRVTVEVGRGKGGTDGYADRWILERRGRTWVIVEKIPKWIS